MTYEQEKVIIALKKCYDGDYDASFFRMAQWVTADRKAVLESLSKDITDFALNIKTKESQYNDGYCDGMLKATKFIDRAVKTMER